MTQATALKTLNYLDGKGVIVRIIEETLEVATMGTLMKVNTDTWTVDKSNDVGIIFSPNNVLDIDDAKNSPQIYLKTS